jgi:GntR family transcriptional regulator / MocR family aminotransferase
MLWFPLQRNGSKTLTQQIYEQIRSRILAGDYLPGDKLPSSRELAQHLGVSRTMAVEAYEQLQMEGFLESLRGSGTYVAKGATLPTPAAPPSYEWDQLRRQTHADHIHFRPGKPSLAHFPRAKWGQIAKHVYQEATENLLGYHSPEGLIELREVLARYLARVRGVQCHPEQILITTGATQAMTLITQCLLAPGSTIAMEDPVTDEIRTIFELAGIRFHPVPVDDKGMQTEHLPSQQSVPLIFVIPSHQFPMGGTLSIQRRVKLIEYARLHDSYIVEDDYDSEFCFEGTPVPSLQGMAPERVIYVGTFSKILSPAIRIGYLILPPPLVSPFRKHKWYLDRHSPLMDQMILSRFIQEGHLDRHIRNMKKVYHKKRNHLIKALTRHFPQVNILGRKAGMHLVAEFPGLAFTEELLADIHQAGVFVESVEHYALQKGRHQHQIVLGFGGLSEEEIDKGIAVIKKAVDHKR